MSYLIFKTPQDATARSDQAGKEARLPFHKGDNDPTRFIWPTISEAGVNGRGALIIEEKKEFLSNAEINSLVNQFPNDWNHPPNPFEQ